MAECVAPVRLRARIGRGYWEGVCQNSGRWLVTHRPGVEAGLNKRDGFVVTKSNTDMDQKQRFDLRCSPLLGP